MKPTVELIGDDGRVIWVQAVDKTFRIPPGNWRLRTNEPFPPDGYRAVGHGSDTTVTVPIDIAQRMLDWQAAIRQSNGGKDTPLSDACGEAAKEIERLRRAQQGYPAPFGFTHLDWRSDQQRAALEKVLRAIPPTVAP